MPPRPLPATPARPHPARKARRTQAPIDGALLIFDALVLSMALERAPGAERETIDKWLAARAARDLSSP